MIAAAVPDVDGLGIILSEVLYWDLHHRLGHNVFFFAAVGALLAAFSRNRLIVFAACFALGWVHFALDYLGSGPGWYLHPWWPVNDTGITWAGAWPFFSWQNISAFVLCLVATLAIAVWRGRTPLEWFMPGLDTQLVALLRRMFQTGSAPPSPRQSS